MEFLGALVGIAVFFGFMYVVVTLRIKWEESRAERKIKQKDEMIKHEVEKELKKAILSASQEYSKNIRAKMDFESFHSYSRYDKSQVFAKYLSEVCEETIPMVSELFEDYHPDKEYVSGEVAAFFYFASYQLLQACGLDGSDILIYWYSECEKIGRDSKIFCNRQMIYEDIFFGAQVRAFWDPSGDRIKSNTNELIFCFMALADFIWEPHMRDVTEHNEYIKQALTVKPIQAAHNFNYAYELALIPTCYFMELVSNTAFKLNLIEK